MSCTTFNFYVFLLQKFQRCETKRMSSKGREEREEVYLEEEIKIQEEDLYEEVTCWIEESQEISMESPKKETKTRELENRGDIRNLLGICQKSKEEERKDKIEERGEDDLICTPRRKVVHIAEVLLF